MIDDVILSRIILGLLICGGGFLIWRSFGDRIIYMYNMIMSQFTGEEAEEYMITTGETSEASGHYLFGDNGGFD